MHHAFLQQLQRAANRAQTTARWIQNEPSLWVKHCSFVLLHGHFAEEGSDQCLEAKEERGTTLHFNHDALEELSIACGCYLSAHDSKLKTLDKTAQNKEHQGASLASCRLHPGSDAGPFNPVLFQAAQDDARIS